MTRLATFPNFLKPVLLATGLLALSACAPTLRPQAPQAQAPAPAPPPIIAEPLAPPPPVDTTVKVALLVPLTGQGADLGQGMLEAAQLALFDLGDDKFQLIPRDTKGTATGAAEAARDAIADGAKLILGPLYSTSVSAVRPAAQAAGVGMISFSNDQNQAGSGIWVIGFSPSDQVKRVVGYARAQGVTRLAGLMPRSPYGDAVNSALNAAAQNSASRVVRLERYDPAVTDLSPTIRSLASGGPGSMDGLMLVEGGQKLRAMASLLPFFEIDTAKVRLLGTGLWDEPGLGAEPALVGGWYASPNPTARREFEDRFQATYGRRPPRLATLAYDAAALAAVLARSGGPNVYDPLTLTNPNGFAGVDGIFRLRPDGLVERGLAVMEITADGNRVIDPAPTSFQAVAF